MKIAGKKAYGNGPPARRFRGFFVVAQGALALLLGYAAIAKLRGPALFAQDIANYRLLPATTVPWVAAALPGVELVLALALLGRRWERAAAWAATGLLVLFALALATAVGRGINLECGCFGAARDPATWWTVARDCGLALGAACIAWHARD